MGIPVIEVGSERMREAFKNGVSNYIPTFRGRRLAEEAGITQISIENWTAIGSFDEVTEIVVGCPDDETIFLIRAPGKDYIATGFGIGYGGEGPCGLATFVQKCGMGTLSEIRSKVCSTDRKFRGTLFSRNLPMPSKADLLKEGIEVVERLLTYLEYYDGNSQEEENTALAWLDHARSSTRSSE